VEASPRRHPAIPQVWAKELGSGAAAATGRLPLACHNWKTVDVRSERLSLPRHQGPSLPLQAPRPAAPAWCGHRGKASWAGSVAALPFQLPGEQGAVVGIHTALPAAFCPSGRGRLGIGRGERSFIRGWCTVAPPNTAGVRKGGGCRGPPARRTFGCAVKIPFQGLVGCGRGCPSAESMVTRQGSPMPRL